ncbi:hypothetical protein [[Eubacterium] cellulosolvens]
MTLPKDRPRLRFTPNSKCNHPKLLALFKFPDLNETVFRCMVCGKTMTTSDLDGKQPWERGRRL